MRKPRKPRAKVSAQRRESEEPWKTLGASSHATTRGNAATETSATTRENRRIAEDTRPGGTWDTSARPDGTTPRAYIQSKTRTQPAKGRRALRLTCAAALIIAAAYCAARVTDIGEGTLAPFRGEAISGDVSTPTEQWRQGSVPDLFQTDPAWASKPYAGATVGENGCGPTCMTAAYIAQTGKTDMDPAKMAAFSNANGFVESGLTTWVFMSEGARMLGLRSTEVPADESTLKDALAQGKTVICSVGPGDFTTQGHFIVVRGVDDAGRLLVMDPNSAERSALTWDAERVIAQCLNIWAISA